jgi:hypothetical protein
MFYLVAVLGALLTLVNLYACVVVLRYPLSTPSQKALQLCFVWLLPPVGALLAVQILKAKPLTRSAGRNWWTADDRQWDGNGSAHLSRCDNVGDSDSPCD